MTESRLQSGAHIAERICCMRIDIAGLEPLVGLRVGGEHGDLLLHDHVHDRPRVGRRAVGGRPLAATSKREIRELQQPRPPRAAGTRGRPGRNSKIRSMTLSSTVARSSAEISALATWTRISKTLFL